jgi:hypothetical protein
MATPIETGTDENRTLAFSGGAGVFVTYTLTATPEGTNVVAHRRKLLADNFDKGRACYVD